MALQFPELDVLSAPRLLQCPLGALYHVAVLEEFGEPARQIWWKVVAETKYAIGFILVLQAIVSCMHRGQHLERRIVRLCGYRWFKSRVQPSSECIPIMPKFVLDEPGLMSMEILKIEDGITFDGYFSSPRMVDAKKTCKCRGRNALQISV
jgi:hypothetical protein